MDESATVILEEIIEVVRLIQQRTVEQIDHDSVPRVVVQIIRQERFSKRIVDRIVDVPVVMFRQVPTIQTVQKTVEVPQVQFFD